MKLRLGAVVLLCLAGCEASDTTIDPGDLTMRDLLGFDPDVALHWDASQRADARDVLAHGLDVAPEPASAGLGIGVAIDERVASTLADLDDTRASAGDGALGLVRVHIGGADVDAEPVPVDLDERAAPPAEIVMDTGWDPSLVTRGGGLVAAMALDAGHDGGPLVVTPAPRLAVAAAYVDAVPAGTRAGADGRAHLMVNPVVLAALDPVSEGSSGGGGGGGIAYEAPSQPSPTPSAPIGVRAQDGNPYSFYGSVDECAYAEQLRCDACLPSNTCEARTIGGDGNAECTTLGATPNAYAEWCIDMSLAIDGVSACVKDKDASCAQDVTAVHRIDASTLAANDDFLTDSTCKGTLDECLGELFGPSQGTYPPQGGTDQPRDTNVSCGDSSPNCTFSPSCDVQGPSCNNSLSCAGGCSSSADQSGCGGDCGSSNGGSGGGCQSCSGGSTSGSGGSCGSCDSGSSSGSGGSCGSCNSGSSTGGSNCGSCDSGSSSGGSGCSGGGCGSSSGGGCSGGSGGGCGGGGGGNNCSVTGKTPLRPLAVLLQIFWALIPVPFATRARRRAKARKAQSEVQS